MTPEQKTHYNKACIGHLATACDAREVELRACDECSNTGLIPDMYMGVQTHRSNCLGEMTPVFNYCPHCSDNRAEADRLDALAKSWCWREEIKPVICWTDLVTLLNTEYEPYIPNPDFTTWSGHGRLIEMIHQGPGLWEKFLRWHFNSIYNSSARTETLKYDNCDTCTLKDCGDDPEDCEYLIAGVNPWIFEFATAEILTTPVLFLQAINSFMEER